jgi:hypothetical protein
MRIEKLPVTVTAGHVFAWNEAEVYRLDGHEPIAGPIELGCKVCDTQPTCQVVGDAVHVLDPCPYPDGITTEITISVPSGKILVSDDLRPVFDWPDPPAVRHSSTIGQAQAVKDMAAIGCAFGPAWNCGLGLYRTGPDRYIVARPGYNEDDDEPSIPGATYLAGICTDIWTYAIADYELWRSRGGDPDKLGWSDNVVDVTPGTYRFIHHSGERGFDHESPGDVIYAHVERIA